MTATTPTPAAPSAPPSKPRHPVEFWLVRGGMLLLVLLVAVQAHARFGYEMTLKKLQSRLAKEEETAEPLLVSEVDGLVCGFPSQTELTDRHWRRRTYSWRGLTQSYQISMPYDSSEKMPAIMSLETPGAPLPEQSKFDEESASPEIASTADVPQMPMPGSPGGGPGMGGPGGGGPRPDPMTNDKDGDGKLSKEEAPERMAANFEEWDSNSDGFIDKDEIAARRARRQQQGGGGPGGGRPQRPSAESNTPAETTTPDAKASETSAEEAKPADAASVTKPAE